MLSTGSENETSSYLNAEPLNVIDQTFILVLCGLKAFYPRPLNLVVWQKPLANGEFGGKSVLDVDAWNR